MPRSLFLLRLNNSCSICLPSSITSSSCLLVGLAGVLKNPVLWRFPAMSAKNYCCYVVIHLNEIIRDSNNRKIFSLFSFSSLNPITHTPKVCGRFRKDHPEGNTHCIQVQEKVFSHQKINVNGEQQVPGIKLLQGYTYICHTSNNFRLSNQLY